MTTEFLPEIVKKPTELPREESTLEIPTAQPKSFTSILRYDFQIDVCIKHPGTILNVGCNEDPAELHKRFGDRVVNCDLQAVDEHLGHRNAATVIFDCLELPWPFEDNTANLVLFGDILEHFTPDAIRTALHEAARVSPRVAITVPEDTRIDEKQTQADWETNRGVKGGYTLHTTILTRPLLLDLLADTRWVPLTFTTGDWGFDNIQGHCVLAERYTDHVINQAET